MSLHSGTKEAVSSLCPPSPRPLPPTSIHYSRHSFKKMYSSTSPHSLTFRRAVPTLALPPLSDSSADLVENALQAEELRARRTRRRTRPGWGLKRYYYFRRSGSRPREMDEPQGVSTITREAFFPCSHRRGGGIPSRGGHNRPPGDGAEEPDAGNASRTEPLSPLGTYASSLA